MNEAFYKESEVAYRLTGSMQLSLLVDESTPVVELDKPERIGSLSETLISIGRRDPDRRWKRSDVTFESILARFGDFSESEHLSALKELMARKAGPRFQPLDRNPTKTGKWITNDETIVVYREA
jgi:hypothetical protein